MKSIILLLLAPLLFAFACSKTKVDIEQEKADLLDTDRAFAAASIEKGAAEAFRMYLTEDALQLPQGGAPLMGRESIYQNMAKSTLDYTLAWTPQQAEVARAGDMGWSWGLYKMNWVDKDGEPKESNGKYLNIWRKMDDGSWRVVVDMGN